MTDAMTAEVKSISPYADAVACPKCKAKVGASCTFRHWDTKQPIATWYHSERIAALLAVGRKP